MKKIFLIGILFIAVLMIGAWIISWLSWQPQSWYSPPDYSQPEIKKLADRAESRLIVEFQRADREPIDKIWHIRIPDEAMNAWLSGRLEDWLTHDQEIEFPPELHSPQVHITQNGIWLAAMIDFDESKPRPIAIKVWAWIDDGLLFVEPIAIRVGKVPIPISIFKGVLSELQQRTGGVEAIAPLMDDREVEIHAITLEEGAIILTCQTHLPK